MKQKSLRRILSVVVAVTLTLSTFLGTTGFKTVYAADLINEGFNGGITAPADWSFTGIGGTYTTNTNFGAASPSLKLDATGDCIVTKVFSGASQLSFWIKGQNTDANSSLKVEKLTGSEWILIEEIKPLPTSGTTMTYPLTSDVSQIRFTYTKVGGNLAFDDVVISDASSQLVAVTGVSLNKTELGLKRTQSETLIANVEPSTASNKTVTWSSDKPEIASVDAVSGKVTAVAAGTAVITAQTQDGGFKASCTVTVSELTLLSISEVRAKAVGDEVAFEGVVSRKSGSNNFVQDDTAGICVYQAGLNINEGDKVIILGKLANYSNLLEVTGATALVTSTGNIVNARVVKIADIGENLESQLVKIEKVTLGAINTSGATPITDSENKKIDIFKIPTLTGIAAGDTVDVTALVGQYGASYQLTVIRAADIVKLVTPDTIAPSITHTPVVSGNTGVDMTVSANVTDDRQVSLVKVYYRAKGTETYSQLEMTKTSAANEYSAAIPKNELSTAGMQYYIEASDGTNTVTSPADKTTPYEAAISAADITGPEITKLSPLSGANTGTNLTPVISAQYSDASGIDTASVKLYLDDIDVTANAAVSETGITYTPANALSIAQHIVKLEVSDKNTVPNKSVMIWNFTTGEIEYKAYFGQLHSHTNLSDGTGTPVEAYTWARDNAKADFFAVTDHSNSFDNDKASENITDVSQSTSTEWKQLRQTADNFNQDGKFVAIGGYEMTWSGSTGGYGHINTFNTPWFVSRNNSAMTLQAYYAKLGQNPESISQLNHPGNTFGDFSDFGNWTPEADKVVNLIEVGNGEGPVRGTGYFPSYEYYTRALDKGWHVAPTNNQDNHKGGWITANTARTVILADSLTRDSLYSAIHQRRVYATEDQNLNIKYTVNGMPMGTELDNPSALNASIVINDPDNMDVIGKVSIIANGGTVVESKTFDSNTAVWNLTIDPQYNYYYVRVDEVDKDIAVTAPVWTKQVTGLGISKVAVSQNPQILNTPTDVTAVVYNNGTSQLSNVKVEFFKNSIAQENKIGEAAIDSIAAANSGTAKITYTPDTTGDIKIYAQMVLNVGGQEKTFVESTTFTVARAEDIVKVVIDGGHSNAYVTGYSPGNIKTLSSMLKDKNFMLVQNANEITAAKLENVRLLILTDPAKTTNFTDAEIQIIKGFVANGGSLVITSRADYDDRGLNDASLNSAAQGNRILEAIGANLRFNDDEVIDDSSNGGQNYRLYFDDYPMSKYNLTANIVPGYNFSFYSGCSVILKSGGSDEKVDWLVKGHSTTGMLDSDGQNDAVPVEKGNINALAAEILPNGSRIIVGGTAFFSDYETAAADNAYSNKTITDNIISWLTVQRPAELKKIADVRADADKDGKPDLLGKRYAVEGIVTAQSVGVGTNNAFFDVIYVQDETGGITVFGVSTKAVPLGTKVRVTGIVDQYEGDAELQIKNENNDIEILDTAVNPVEPKVMTTKESMLEENEGWFVKITGKVVKIVTDNSDNSLYIDDGTGIAKVYVNGYIGDGTSNPDMLGKWDKSIAVGDTVSAAGLASEDAAGHRIRVRNTAEIVKIIIPVTGITLDKTSVTLKKGSTLQLTPVIAPDNAANKAVEWTSSKPEIASVDSNGLVMAISSGVAEITAKTVDGSYEAKCIVTVGIPVTGVKLNRTTADMKLNKKLQLVAIVAPYNATYKTVKWSSSNTAVATVDTNGVVKSVGPGEAVITAETTDGGCKASCSIKVTIPVTGISLNKTYVSIKKGNTFNLTAVVKPGNATNKDVIWTSLNKYVASVDKNGKVTANRKGIAIIAVTTADGYFTAYCIVLVK